MPPRESSARSGRDGGRTGSARFAGVTATGPVECVDLRAAGRDALATGFWAVVGTFEGEIRAWRFEDVVHEDEAPTGAGPWVGPDAGEWGTSLDREAYRRAVGEVRSRIRDGDVYQVNVCRVLSAALPARGGEPDPHALAGRLRAGNPAPYGGVVHVPASSGLPPVWVVTASPELFLEVADGVVSSGPIKGTATTPEGLSDKDRAENVMIADLVRNDLQQVCRPGTVEVDRLLEVQHHPGLVHLVTTVRGALVDSRPDWPAVLAATYPPASVSGAPKLSALEVIAALEPVPRGPYCGAVGWIDADRGRARLAVGIRTFWWTPDDGGTLRFGTGAGITWESEADAEWAETELKARRLVALAGGEEEGSGSG